MRRGRLQRPVYSPLTGDAWLVVAIALASMAGIRAGVAATAYTAPAIDAFSENTIVRSSDAEATDLFGGAVAISGDTAVIGARSEDGGPGSPLVDSGAAYVRERDHGGAGNWGEIRKLTALDAQAGDLFGASVAVSGDTAIVGAHSEDGGPGDPRTGAGAAYVFERNQGGANNWGQIAKLIASDAQALDRFGWSVSISGDTAIVGANGEAGGPGDPLPAAGAVYVFERNQGGANNWGQIGRLTASDLQADDSFGDSVAISGDLAIVGAGSEDGGPGDPLSGAGAAYVFGRNQGGPANWGQVARLAASDAQAGDSFGASVAISDSTAVVGARAENGGPGEPLPGAGAAYAFERHQGGADNWGETAKLTASDAQADDHMGASVAIVDDAAIVGAPGEDIGPGDPLPEAGAAYVFQRRPGGTNAWIETAKLIASDTQADDSFGVSVAISNDTALIGAELEDGGAGEPFSAAGAAYVYERTTWAYVLDSHGGLHVAGPGAVPIDPAPPYFGFAIARDAELSDSGAHVLDGFGGVHPAGGAPVLSPGPPYFGFDIGRDLELDPTGGGYVLDGFGGVHAFAGAAVLSPATPYFGFDGARDLELDPTGGGYYMVDARGGLHAGGGATTLAPGPRDFGFDMARDLELAEGGGAYVLDGYGGVHAAGGAPVPAPATPYFGFDVARDLELAEGGGYLVLDGYGGLHAGGGAATISPAPPYFGFDVARDLELRSGVFGRPALPPLITGTLHVTACCYPGEFQVLQGNIEVARGGELGAGGWVADFELPPGHYLVKWVPDYPSCVDPGAIFGRPATVIAGSTVHVEFFVFCRSSPTVVYNNLPGSVYSLISIVLDGVELLSGPADWVQPGSWFHAGDIIPGNHTISVTNGGAAGSLYVHQETYNQGFDSISRILFFGSDGDPPIQKILSNFGAAHFWVSDPAADCSAQIYRYRFEFRSDGSYQLDEQVGQSWQSLRSGTYAETTPRSPTYTVDFNASTEGDSQLQELAHFFDMANGRDACSPTLTYRKQ